MSIRDADLLERIVLIQASRASRPLQVLEWGIGRSTLWYTAMMDRRSIDYRWIGLEHHREFFVENIMPELDRRWDCGYVEHEHLLASWDDLTATTQTGIRAVIFDAGELRPFETGSMQDRNANLDEFVDLPSRLGGHFDLILVDGRKRRRCLLEAAKLMSHVGVVVLHDAWRAHYQCAFAAFSFGSLLGDELWLGAQHDPDLSLALPAHAFMNHAEP